VQEVKNEIWKGDKNGLPCAICVESINRKRRIIIILTILSIYTFQFWHVLNKIIFDHFLIYKAHVLLTSVK
jgi:hypothetical protein